MILERVFLFEELIRVVNQLLKQFLIIRVSDKWRDELLLLRAWVSQQENEKKIEEI